MTRFSTFDSWVANVKSAPRCSICDEPLGLGDFSNYDQVASGETDAYLCIKCVVHYDAATRWNGHTECHNRISASWRDTLYTTNNIDLVTCHMCLNAKMYREYIANLMSRDREYGYY